MRRPLALAVVTLLLACGAGASKPPSAVPGDGKPPPSTAREVEATPEPAAKPCADGTCVECGDGVCPSGFFCERAKSGARGCAWVAPCAEKPTCGCIAPHVKGCACEDKGGVAFVTCS